MSNDPIERNVARVREVQKKWRRETTPAQMRLDWDTLFGGDPAEADEEKITIGDLPATWLRAPGARRDRALLFFHGGGFTIGSATSHRGIAARLSAAAGCAVLVLEYRLAPEHHFPAPIADATLAHEYLTEGQNLAPADIAFGGDSAGGNLVLSTMLALRERDVPLPRAGVLLSPWLDLTVSLPSYDSSLASQDPLNRKAGLSFMAKGYLNGADAKHPLASPLFADLRGLPPLLVQVGSRELVLGDSQHLARRAKEAGVDVHLTIHRGMVHVFHQFAEDVPEAREAIGEVGQFLKGQWA